jgi:hypothetical protein
LAGGTEETEIIPPSELESMVMEVALPDLRYYSGICLEGWKKLKKNHKVDSP